MSERSNHLTIENHPSRRPALWVERLARVHSEVAVVDVGDAQGQGHGVRPVVIQVDLVLPARA